MPLYRYSIEPLSAFATPLRSDTLYGHLLWAAAQMQGDQAVEGLIREFDSPSPPFRLRSAFPEGYLPMPLLPGMSRERFRKEYGQKGKRGLLQHLDKYKTFRKIKYLPVTVWRERRGAMSQERLFRRYLEEPWDLPEQKSWLQPHNSIDRRTGTVLDQGGLFFVPVTFHEPGSRLHLYLEAEDPRVFEELMAFVAQPGFGADAGTGKGQFDWQRDQDFDPGMFEGPGSWRMNLSVCSCRELADFEGYFAPLVKLGKAWSGFGERNPFKKPFLAFAEGSVFKAMPRSGYLLTNIHSDPKIVQVTWPLTLLLELEEAA
jgi:CRISPR-associated protein Csm4